MNTNVISKSLGDDCGNSYIHELITRGYDICSIKTVGIYYDLAAVNVLLSRFNLIFWIMWNLYLFKEVL